MAKYHCKYCGAPSLNETCWRHTPKNGIKSTPTRKKVVSQEQLDQDTEDATKMWDFFMTIWDSKPHICEETGKYLGMEPKWTHFHHLLFKQTYPQYKYEGWNIMLLHPDVHILAHQDIDKTPKVKERAEDVWSEYVMMQRAPNTNQTL